LRRKKKIIFGKNILFSNIFFIITFDIKIFFCYKLLNANKWCLFLINFFIVTKSAMLIFWFKFF